jgi:phenylalanyl-tRNA synthetase beta chain
MKIPLAWLENYVQLPPVDELLPRLTEIGHMVDGFVRLPENQSIVSLEIRANRPDCLSIFGIACEVGAAFGTPVRALHLADLPHKIHQSAAGASDYVCFLHIKGARLDLLPANMQESLEQYGQGPVNPFVDLANYVMVELGQPLHVYDASKVDIASAQSRLARVAESLVLLNGEEVMLSENDLIIADDTGPLSLAGVMGGDATKVVSTSCDIVVEAGNFRPELVRRTARSHGLMTEASQRCSKLLAPQFVPIAMQRFLALLLQYGEGGEVELWQSGLTPERVQGKEVSIILNHRDIWRISGVRISIEKAEDILVSLGFHQMESTQDGKIVAAPPWWRTDVEHPADVIEEVLRIHGYSKVPFARLDSKPIQSDSDNAWQQEEAVRNILCAWGYDEVILDAFLLDNVGDVDGRQDIVRVVNPPAGSRDTLRPSLVPNMLSSSRFLPLLTGQRRLFEIGRTFYSAGGQPAERRTAAWITMLGSSPASWHQTCQPDFYSMKSEAATMLDALGLPVFSEVTSPIPHPFLAGKSSCLLDKSGQVVGYIGELNHQAYDLKPVRKNFAVEIYLPAPSSSQAQQVSTPRREVDSFDISVMVDENTRVSTIQEIVREMLGPDLVAIRLIDVYTGKQIKAGLRSFTFRIVYARSRGEPGMIWTEVSKIITQKLHAEIRGAS